MSASIISFVSAKGGTGKTTTALNLSVAFAERGKKTLLFDLDPMGSIGFSLARGDREWEGFVEHLLKRVPIENVIVQTKLENLHILPRGRMAPFDVCSYERLIHSSKALANTLFGVLSQYDLIILDTPSGLGMVTTAALEASSFAVVALQAEPLSLRSIGQTLALVDRVQKTKNPNLKLLGLLPTMVDLANPASRAIHHTISTSFDGVLEAFTPRSAQFIEASEKGIPLSFLGGRRTQEMNRFSSLAAELEGRIEELNGKTGGQNDYSQRTLV